ncbi:MULTISPECIES: glycosyltransferase family 2 protein [Rothia]|uniref:Glycosyltransferase family 2 protein n=1 Tax=Rothia amarae TaxID=169480 RepID=A0A7H2BJY5_9MICC|nr:MULTISPECIES: glycosyltransferase family 2 protein [Rothia]QNV39981.1 glycosyltransferase family 2 protein [Rothia amarae]SIK60868.1 Possible polyprenol phosphate mannosyl transferase 1 (Ppm1) [Mycobacteroides abscessus subsp. abscessus]
MQVSSVAHGEPRTLIIMPAWNEEEVIGGTITELFRMMPEVDLLVVNDGSSDNTSAIAREAGALVIDLPYNMGIGGALRTGYKYARMMDYDRAIQVDADGQHDPKGIRTVLAGLDDVDISIGSRFAEADNYTVKGPRKWAMVLLAWMFSSISGKKFTDATSGFRAANRRAIAQYCEHLPAEYLGDCIDACVMAIRAGLTVKQVPVEMRERQAGTPSSNPWKSAVYLVRSIFSFAISMTRKKSTVKDS